MSRPSEITMLYFAGTRVGTLHYVFGGPVVWFGQLELETDLPSNISKFICAYKDWQARFEDGEYVDPLEFEQWPNFFEPKTWCVVTGNGVSAWIRTPSFSRPLDTSISWQTE